MNKYILKLTALVVVLTIFTFGCKTKTQIGVKDNKKLNVCTSFYAMYDFAKKIGGDKVNITNLVPSGTEPHDWEPTPSDIAKIHNADVFVYSGAGMEGWIEKVFNSNNNKKLIAVETTEDLPLVKNNDTNEQLQYDPHVWLNPKLALEQMRSIMETFSSIDPANAGYYQNNFNLNEKRIEDLDAKYKATVSKFTKKDIVVAHKAFGYLCNAYGLNQIAIEGMSAESEPSPARMAEISKFAKQNHVKYIFFEELISPKVAQTIANEAGAQTAVLNPFEGLSQADINANKDYYSVMEDNLNALSKALQ